MAHKMATKSESLTGTRTMTVKEARAHYAWFFSPTATRQVTLPDETLMGGHLLAVVNTNATFQLDLTGSDAATAVTSVAAGGAVQLICDGTLWRVNSATAADIEASALHGLTSAADKVPVAATAPVCAECRDHERTGQHAILGAAC